MLKRPTEVQNFLPNLIIAGTGRAGTTSLFRYLADHPGVCASLVKEVHFFDQKSKDRLNQESLNKYGSYFHHCSPDIPIRMEATPLYLNGGKRIAEAIYSVIPDVKLIFTLREPISRAFTVFRAFRIKEPETFGDLSFDDYVAIGLDSGQAERNVKTHDRAERISSYLTDGCYARFLSEYYSVFPREQLCVLFFDDFSKDVRSVMLKVTEFLNIDPRFFDSYKFHVENRTRSYRFSLLHRFAYGVNMKLERTLNRYPAVRSSLRQIYDKVNERKDHKDQISELAWRQLQKFYEPYNRELYALLKHQVPHARLPEWLARADEVRYRW
jgi:hypothetical protein